MLCLQEEPIWRSEEAGKTKGFVFVVDGENVDDHGDFRPGTRATRNWGSAALSVKQGYPSKDSLTLEKTGFFHMG